MKPVRVRLELRAGVAVHGVQRPDASTVIQDMDSHFMSRLEELRECTDAGVWFGSAVDERLRLEQEVARCILPDDISDTALCFEVDPEFGFLSLPRLLAARWPIETLVGLHCQLAERVVGQNCALVPAEVGFLVVGEIKSTVVRRTVEARSGELNRVVLGVGHEAEIAPRVEEVAGCGGWVAIELVVCGDGAHASGAAARLAAQAPERPVLRIPWKISPRFAEMFVYELATHRNLRRLAGRPYRRTTGRDYETMRHLALALLESRSDLWADWIPGDRAEDCVRTMGGG